MQKKSLLSIVFLGTSLLALTSCGNKDNSKSSVVSEVNELQEVPGLYRATISGINTGPAGNSTGVFVLKIEGDEIQAEMHMEGTHAQVVHKQYLRSGTQCPDFSADKNADGIIDIVEAEAVSGMAFMPLDSNLNSQSEGANFPVSRTTGEYHYSETASLNLFMTDLFSPDENLLDAVVKFEAGQDLNLSGRTIMIHGVSDATQLPETVATQNVENAQATLPIACGILRRVENSDPVVIGDGGKN